MSMATGLYVILKLENTNTSIPSNFDDIMVKLYQYGTGCFDLPIGVDLCKSTNLHTYSYKDITISVGNVKTSVILIMHPTNDPGHLAPNRPPHRE